MKLASSLQATLVLLSLISCLSGCKDVRVDAGTDARFLHQPEELFAPVAQPKKPLFPLKVGTKWKMELTEQGKTIEEQTLLGKRAISGVECQILGIRREGGGYREEYFVVNDKGIYQVGGGGAERITMKPPLPILTFPLELGKSIEWQGGITVPKGMVPGRAWSRLRGVERVKVPAGVFDAYRTDTALEANINGRIAVFMTARWFVPGKGIVKTRYLIRQAGQPPKEFQRELVR